MRKMFIIALSNMRKAKGQTVTIIVLIFLASIMLNLWLMLSIDYSANFNRYHDQFNAEHVTLSIDDKQGEVRAFLTDELSQDKQVSEFRLDSCLSMVGTFPYNDGMMNGWFVFMTKDLAVTRSIGKAEIVDNSNLTSGAYLPMVYKTGDVAIGNTIDISVGSHTVSFKICGFFNSIMMGSHNCALTEIILTEDQYQRLEELDYAEQATLCSVRLKDVSNNTNFEASLKSAITKQFPNKNIVGNNYDIVRQARYISQGICSAIMCVMAFLTLLIAVVVIVSNIVNYIQVNMKNLGVLKAAGYTSRQLILSLLVQFLGVTLCTSLLGVGISYGIFPAINKMMISQTGIPYQLRFLPLPLFISILILGGTVAFFVWFASRKIKKIEPIMALRSGVSTHNFKRNHIPLEKTKAPVNLALALKTTFSGIKHNITICITMLVLSLIVVFCGLMTENVIMDMTPFLNLIVGETADSCINVDTKAEDQFLKQIEQDSRVEKIYLYTSLNVSHLDGKELMATICDDFSRVNNQNVVFKGRFPKYDNEIAIAAKYAKEAGFEVGNEIEINANGKTEKYLISGFTQITNNLGRDCLLTREGYERLGELSNVSYYLNLTEGTNIDSFNMDIKEQFNEDIYTVINIDKTMQGASSVYVSLITIIVVAILIVSAIIIVFVLYLLVRTMLSNKRQDYGILKSLGYTTKQLVIQTALSFMPAIIISTIVGLFISCLIINPLMSLFFSTIGIVKCTFNIPIVFVMIAGFGLVGFSFGIACLLSLKIKKIVPRSLLAGE